ncbi:MAG: asparagine synthase, partial [Candidatus Desulforudis sp.]|nr:asparagine synthase [Desulforudis sp.]
MFDLIGIAAVCGVPDETTVRHMLSRLKHRGPQASGVLSTADAALGYAGHDDEALHAAGEEAIVFDGDPAARDVKPQTILATLTEQGAGGLARIHGAFALVARTRRGLIAARDRFGLKPLYYGRSGTQVFFASELKALVGTCDRIAPVLPGTYYRTDSGLIPFDDGKLNNDEPVPATTEAAGEKLRQLLTRAVSRRLPDDRNVGVFLSGGLDSSIVAAVTTRLRGPVKTFAAGYEGSPDLRHARVAADHLGTDHTDYRYAREEMLRVLPRVIYHLESFDWSLVRSAVANYLVARLAGEHGVDIILAGEGADELFGGYHYLKDKAPAAQVRELENLLRAGHNIGFQRVDRMTAAFALDCSMPFMDQDLVRLATALPIEWKIHGPDHLEKWILRRSFSDYLPDQIIRRRKDEFSQGAGSAAVIEALAEQEISDAEFVREREPFPGRFLR